MYIYAKGSRPVLAGERIPFPAVTAPCRALFSPTLLFRMAGPLSRPPLRSEVVVLPHPSLPASAAQPWLTEKGCLAVAFLLLGGGGGDAGGAPRSKRLMQGDLACSKPRYIHFTEVLA